MYLFRKKTQKKVVSLKSISKEYLITWKYAGVFLGGFFWFFCCSFQQATKQCIAYNPIMEKSISIYYLKCKEKSLGKHANVTE